MGPRSGNNNQYQICGAVNRKITCGSVFMHENVTPGTKLEKCSVPTNIFAIPVWRKNISLVAGGIVSRRFLSQITELNRHRS